MKSKRLILIAFACLPFAAMLCSLISARPKSRINEDTIQLIKVGMTREEVESILGKSTGDRNSSRICYLCPPAPPYRPWNYKNDPVFWGSDEAQVRIHFDDTELVEGVYEDWRIETQVTMWGRIRGWLYL
jgi:hypothetical protein